MTVYLCLKHIVRKNMVYYTNKSDIGHTHLKQKYKKNTQTTFVSPSKNSDENGKEKKIGNCKAFFVICKRNYELYLIDDITQVLLKIMDNTLVRSKVGIYFC